MGHSYNNGLHTTSKGITIDAIRLTNLTVTVGQTVTIAEDCKSGLIASVTHTATGVYTFQMTSPFLPKFVCIQPQLSGASATAATIQARYQTGSFNPTTGVFIVHTTTGGAATDPGATDELHVDMRFRRYTT